MNEQFNGKRFSFDIDRLLYDKSTEPCMREREEVNKAEDEYGIIMDLAREVVSVDYATESTVRQGILDKLLEKMAKQNPHGNAGSQEAKPGEDELKDDELKDDELARVAGGRTLSGNGQGCSMCGCSRSAAGSQGGFCPECGHPWTAHS